ncbi:MAG: sigma-54-dependent Fis family transcriptional regulator [Fibrobacteres bacterium]|nr:sigma-54-dependent Fis family transcriptional regulator [Fibrobacterota bacterium]
MVTMDSENRLEKLLSASSILHDSLELSVLLKRIMELLSDSMASEKGAIYLIDTETGEFALGMAAGAEGALRIEKRAGAAQAAGAGVPVLIEDATKDPRWKEEGSNAKSVLCVPLKYGDRILGLAEVVNKIDGTPYTNEDLKFFQGLTNICAAAILNSTKFTALELENRRLKSEVSPAIPLIGNAPSMIKIFSQIKKAAATDALVLVTGESGTGKEVVAKSLHMLSSRNKHPFLPVNCGALPETLLESELFGHEKGAFTGADKARAGIFEEANGGTVFLDEIGETTPATQVKLLRVLQEGKVKRLGSNKEIPFNARIIAATNRSLETMVEEKKIREDLYYRLNVLRILLPPLRKRREDIPVLADYFLKKATSKLGRSIEGFSSAVFRTFADYPWKGNVRELENAVEASVAMADGPYIEITDLPESFQDYKPSGFDGASLSGMNYKDASDLFEKSYFKSLLELTNGDTSLAAEKAGVSEKSVQRRKSEFGL